MGNECAVERREDMVIFGCECATKKLEEELESDFSHAREWQAEMVRLGGTVFSGKQKAHPRPLSPVQALQSPDSDYSDCEEEASRRASKT